MDERVLLGDCDDFGQHVSQPDRVNEVEVVETAKMVIVVKENAVVMEKLGSWGGEK